VADSIEQQSPYLLHSSDNKLVTVISARELQSPDLGRSTRHIEFKLPSGMGYHEGDQLAIFPENDSELVLRVASLLNEHDLGWVVAVTANSNDYKPLHHFPFGVPTKGSDLFVRHIDL